MSQQEGLLRDYSEGIELFMQLFSGRDDVYGMNALCIKSNLTKEIYDDHLKGVQRIGVYPIHKNNLVKWIACDVDDDEVSDGSKIPRLEKIILLKKRAEHFGFESYIETSKSKGYHLWTFFKDQIESVKVRLIFEMFFEELGFKCELFPKQDNVEIGAFGNYINLPLYGNDVRRDKTVFIDEESKTIIPSASLLKKIKLNSIKLVNEIIADNSLVRTKTYLREHSNTQLGFGNAAPIILPCIEKMRKGVRAGHRDMACYRLASYYKQRNMFHDDVVDILITWNTKNEQPARKKFSEKDIIKTVDSVFKNDYRGYGCEDSVVGLYCDESKCPMATAKARKKRINDGVITMTFRDANVMVFQKQKYEFRLQHFEFTRSGKFKASLTLSREGEILLKDIINLGVASQRKRYVNACDGDEAINQDIIDLEGLVRKQIEKEEKEKLNKKKQVYVMTEKEKQEAIKFLTDTPHILSEVIKVTNRMGVVGEEDLRLMAYLCFSSRIMKSPISITVKGESSSGKSFTCQQILALIPEEGYKFMTKATQQAFYHLEEDGLQHRIIYINELPGSESADYSIRSAQSEGDLVLMMPIKDPNSGDMMTIEKRVKGPVGFLSTTTKANIFDENETRNFSVFSDDSPELTRAIGEITKRKARGEDFVVDDHEINLWKNVQRLLNSEFRVIIPYAEIFDSFPDKPVRIRRDRDRFRVLIEVVTLIHQFHREQKQNGNGQTHIISTLADYYIAKVIAEDILTYTIFEIGPSAEQLWKIIQEDESDFIRRNNESKIPQEYQPIYTFTYKTISEKAEWKKSKVKKWMYALLNAGLIEYADKSGGGKSKESMFKIARHGEQWSHDVLNFLPKVEDLYVDHKCAKNLFYNPITGRAINPINSEAPEGLLD